MYNFHVASLVTVSGQAQANPCGSLEIGHINYTDEYSGSVGLGGCGTAYIRMRLDNLGPPRYDFHQHMWVLKCLFSC